MGGHPRRWEPKPYFFRKDGAPLKPANVSTGDVVTAERDVNVRSGPANWHGSKSTLRKGESAKIVELRVLSTAAGKTQLWARITEPSTAAATATPPSRPISGPAPSPPLPNVVGMCDLSHLDVPKHFTNSAQFGTGKIRAETRMSLDFVRMRTGEFTIRRTNVAYLLDINNQIQARISEADKSLPKNDCNEFAEIPGGGVQIGPTPPTFSVGVTTKASFWTCSPAIKVPCPKLNDLLPGARLHKSASIAEPDELDNGTIIFSQFGGFTPPGFPRIDPPPGAPRIDPPPGVPHIDPPPGFPHVDPTHPPVGIGMCDAPRVKNKDAEGSVVSKIVLSGKIENNAPKITTSKSQAAHLNDQTRFLMALLGGPGFVVITGSEIEKALEHIASDNLADIPTEIAIPKADLPLQLHWVAKTAAFDSRLYGNMKIPALVVVWEISQSGEANACGVRNMFSNIK